MSESLSRRPFRIPSDLAEEYLPRWHVRTDDGQLRGPLSDHGLKALAEVAILTERAEIRGVDAEKFIPIQAHPIWLQIKAERPLRPALNLRESRPPMTMPSRENVFASATAGETSAFWSVRPDYPSARDAMREISPRARTRRARLEAQHMAKVARIFAALRIAGGLRFIREVFVFAFFLALGDLFRRGFIEALGAARWLAVFCVVLLAMFYYLCAAFVD